MMTISTYIKQAPTAGISLQGKGFTLVEMALVLLIIGLLTKIAIAPLAGMQAHRMRMQAEQQLQGVREAVFSHIVAYGAIPCPLSDESAGPSLSHQNTLGAAGYSVPPGGSIIQAASVCTVSAGVVPARQLRLAGAVNAMGALLDPWGNVYRYSVSLSNAETEGSTDWPDWTTAGEAAAVGIGNLSADLVLCNTATSGNCGGRNIRADQIAFVVLTTGADESTSASQSENLDNDNYFVVTEESIQQEQKYDDIVVWGSAADVMYWMLRMGWLP